MKRSSVKIPREEVSKKKKNAERIFAKLLLFRSWKCFCIEIGIISTFFFNKLIFLTLRALWEQQLKGKEILRLEIGVEIARLKILSCFSESRKIIVFLWWWLSSKAMLFNVCLENFGRRNLLLYLYFETVRGEIESRSKIRSSLPYYLFL